MLKWIRKYFPGKIRSGTDSYKKPIDVFKDMIGRFPNLGENDKICLWTKQCKGQVQIKKYYIGQGILVGLKFPFKVPKKPLYETVFSNAVVRIPEHWTLYKQRRHIYIFRAFRYKLEEIPCWLDDVFVKVFRCPEDYQIIGKIDLGTWHSEDRNPLFGFC